MIALDRQFSAQGLAILAFPCNQFGFQEPRSNEAIESFADSKKIKFDMMEKIDVNGSDSSMVFAWLKMSTGTEAQDISWNFGTYWLITKDGQASRHDSVSPKDLQPQIEADLK